MRRTMYNFSPEFSGAMRLHKLYPVARVGLAPGETISGKISLTVLMDTAIKPILNSAVLDIYGFYVPYRVAWDGWPDWLTGGSTPPALTAAAALEFFEYGTGITDLFRRCYMQIYNHYFLHQEDTQLSIPPTISQQVNNLQTLNASTLDDVAAVETVMQLPVDGTPEAELNVTDLRRAMTADRRAQRRATYGDGYFDILREIGITVPAALIEEPEMIFRDRKRVKFLNIANTSATGQGSRVANGGIDVTVPLRNFIAMEHGQFVVVACLRVRAPNIRSRGPFDGASVNTYFRQDQLDEPTIAFSTQYLSHGSSGSVHMPPFEYLRRADDYVAAQSWSITRDAGASGVDAATLRRIDPDTFDAYFADTIGDDPEGGQYHAAFSCWADLQRLSPVIPRGVGPV